MSVYLGIDVGTSGTKTLAIREEGTILASATVEYPLSTPKPGWSEQNPEALVASRDQKRAASHANGGTSPPAKWPGSA